MATSKAGGLAGQAVGTARGATGQTSQRTAFLMLIIGNVLWAGTYAAGKIALEDLSPIELNALRFSLAALFLSPALIRGWRQIPRDRRSLLLLGQIAVMGWILNKALEYFGLALSTASDVALLIATESIFTALLSWLFLREHITRMGVLALLVGLLGAYLIVERGFVPNLAGGAASSARIIGDLLVIGSLVLEAAYTVRGKTALSTLSLPPLLLTSATLTGSLFVWIPAGVGTVIHSGMPHMTLAGWLSVIYMAGAASALGYWLWFQGLRTVDASAAAPILFIQPLVGAALGIWLLHDQLGWATLLGGGLIGLSLLLVLLGTRRPASSVVPVTATIIDDFTITP